MLVIDGWGIHCEIALIWMSPDFTDDQSTLVQVMAWCRLATNHYLSDRFQTSQSLQMGLNMVQCSKCIVKNVAIRPHILVCIVLFTPAGLWYSVWWSGYLWSVLRLNLMIIWWIFRSLSEPFILIWCKYNAAVCMSHMRQNDTIAHGFGTQEQSLQTTCSYHRFEKKHTVRTEYWIAVGTRQYQL